MATENGSGRVAARTQVPLQNEVFRWKQRCEKLKAECARLRRELAIHKERRSYYWQIIRDDLLKLKPEDFEVDEDWVRYDVIEPHIARITINRPDRRNAISEDGSKVFFTSNSHLYMRDTAAGTTTRIDVPEEPGVGVEGGAEEAASRRHQAGSRQGEEAGQRPADPPTGHDPVAGARPDQRQEPVLSPRTTARPTPPSP